MEDASTKKELAAKVRALVDELRSVPYNSHEELSYLIDKYEAFLKKVYGDNCHQIRFLKRITFKPSTDNNKEHVIMKIWYGGLNEVIVLSNTLLEEFGDEPAEVDIEYEQPEVEEDEEPEEEFFPTDEAAEIARKIQEIEEEEAQKAKAGVKEKENIRETPKELKEFEKRVDVMADVLTFIFEGFIWFGKSIWKVLKKLIIQPEKLFKEWKDKISASMQYKTVDEADQNEPGDAA